MQSVHHLVVSSLAPTHARSPYIMHRNERLWDDAAAFDAQRWLRMQQGEAGGYVALLRELGPNGAYIPFGAGPVSACCCVESGAVC